MGAGRAVLGLAGWVAGRTHLWLLCLRETTAEGLAPPTAPTRPYQRRGRQIKHTFMPCVQVGGGISLLHAHKNRINQSESTRQSYLIFPLAILSAQGRRGVSPLEAPLTHGPQHRPWGRCPSGTLTYQARGGAGWKGSF